MGMGTGMEEDKALQPFEEEPEDKHGPLLDHMPLHAYRSQ